MAAGRKTGGRKEGTPNKSTLARQSAPGAPDPDFMTSLKEPARFPAYKLARVDALVPYDRNPRTHTPAQVDKIAASVREFGFTNPVLVDGKRGVVAGHGRLLAAKALGMDVVPTIELSHLTAAQRRAYVLADNRLAEDAGWDMDLLASELGELSDDGFDLSLTGFSERELVSFMAGAGGNTDPDEIPEPEAVAVSRLGDVWSLGAHRLACGDCTDAVVVELVTGGLAVDLVVTSPPYNQRIDSFKPSGMHKDHGWVKKVGRLAYKDDLPEPEYQNAQRALLGQWIELLRDGGSLFYNHKNRYRDKQVVSPLTWLPGPFAFRQEIVWSRPGSVTQNARMFLPSDERIYWLYKGSDFTFNDTTEIKSWSTVWSITPQANLDHAVAFPAELPSRCIQAASEPGDSIYEPYSGSGTTIIAAEMTGRICHAIEVEPRYVDVAIRRWQAFTGLEATLSTGQSFAEIEAERLAVAA